MELAAGKCLAAKPASCEASIALRFIREAPTPFPQLIRGYTCSADLGHVAQSILESLGMLNAELQLVSRFSLPREVNLDWRKTFNLLQKVTCAFLNSSSCLYSLGLCLGQSAATTPRQFEDGQHAHEMLTFMSHVQSTPFQGMLLIKAQIRQL